MKDKRFTKKGISDSTMQRHWRLSVYKQCGGRCAVTGRTENLQAHHWLRDRRYKLTRDDRRNGILVSSDPYTFWIDGKKQVMSPHMWVENTPEGRRFADKYMRGLGLDIDGLEKVAGWNCMKDYLTAYSLTRDEYLRSLLEEMRAYLNS